MAQCGNVTLWFLLHLVYTEKNGLVEGPGGFWTDVGSRGLTDAEGATWSGSRVLLPLILSTTALVLTAFAGCYCFAKSKLLYTWFVIVPQEQKKG